MVICYYGKGNESTTQPIPNQVRIGSLATSHPCRCLPKSHKCPSIHLSASSIPAHPGSGSMLGIGLSPYPSTLHLAQGLSPHQARTNYFRVLKWLLALLAVNNSVSCSDQWFGLLLSILTPTPSYQPLLFLQNSPCSPRLQEGSVLTRDTH